jgi:organic hydroperoxide reductase OsmC/OhrA
MEIAATVSSRPGQHHVAVRTDDRTQALAIAGRPAGGSAVNGGELLMLALATCYCNDLYREAARMGLVLDAVEVEASATFEGVGLAASEIRYTARVTTAAPPADVERLLRETDAVAEVHNTLRQGAAVTFMQEDDADPAR